MIEGDGSSESWFKNGERHRDGDKPAVIFSNGSKEQWSNGIWVKSMEVQKDRIFMKYPEGSKQPNSYEIPEGSENKGQILLDSLYALLTTKTYFGILLSKVMEQTLRTYERAGKIISVISEDHNYESATSLDWTRFEEVELDGASLEICTSKFYDMDDSGCAADHWMIALTLDCGDESDKYVQTINYTVDHASGKDRELKIRNLTPHLDANTNCLKAMQDQIYEISKELKEDRVPDLYED